jgi:hypothetical protein
VSSRKRSAAERALALPDRESAETKKDSTEELPRLLSAKPEARMPEKEGEGAHRFRPDVTRRK